LWLGWDIVSNTAADIYAAGRAETALAWSGGHPGALVRLAEQQLASETDEPDLEGVTNLAKRALKGDPLEAGSLRVMARAAQLAEDMPRAESLMTLAGLRSRRDLGVEGWLFERKLVAKDYAGAVAHADAALRVWPEAYTLFLPVLVALANDPDGRAPLAATLAKDPPWRKWLLSLLPKESEKPATLYSFYARLRAGQAPLTEDEFRPYMQRLVETGDYSLAYAMQVEFLPAERIAMLGHLNNGGFDHPISGLPFDWRIESVRGARTEIVVDANANRALRVEFHNTRVPFQHVSQMLLLQPGEYRLHGQVRAVALTNERGMRWVISCVDDRRMVLLETDRVTGSTPWTEFDAPFDVRDDDRCRAQEIRLVLAARIAAEQEVGGEIWYDGLQIERREPESGPVEGGAQ
jgi:hypothetical protein